MSLAPDALSLYVDWCDAADVDVRETTADTLDAFFEEVPVSASTQRQRARMLRRELAQIGVDLPAPDPVVASAWREGPGWLPLCDALERMPVSAWPASLRARRDAWLLVLLGHLRLTRREALAVSWQEVVARGGEVTVRGIPVPPQESPLRCPACAVTRWARILREVDHHRYRARAVLMAYPSKPEFHDCAEDLSDGWGSGLWQLVPAIDRHGWVTDWRPMSLRAVSATVAYWLSTLLDVTEAKADAAPSPDERPGWWDDDDEGDAEREIDPDTTLDDLYVRLDEQVAATDEVLKRVEEAMKGTRLPFKPSEDG